MTRAPDAPPGRLVDPATGRVRFGVYDGEPLSVNLDQALLRVGGLAVPARLARLRLKQWQHFALVLPDLFVGLAVVDAGFLRTSWCHVVERGTGRQFEHRRMSPVLRLRVARELWRGETAVHARGYHVAVENQLDLGEHRLELAISAAGDRPALGASLRCRHDLERVRPLVAVLPVEPCRPAGRSGSLSELAGPGPVGPSNRAMYTHKVPLPLEGMITVGGRTYRTSAEDSFAILDVHKAHYPRHTFWRWATFAGREPAGRVLGMNLTKNVNPDDTRLNENALWLDGQLQLLGPARFDFDPRDMSRPWRLGTADGAVDLTFTPEGERGEDLDLGLLRSVFRQLHGTFSGEVRFGSESVAVERLFGLCEDHDSVW